MSTIIDLIRHGEPLGGRAIRGNSIDDPLSDLGWQQMRSAVADYRNWDVVISSPLIRCLDFSQELSSNLGIPLVVEQDFKEVGFGSWEGHTKEEIKKNNPEEYKNFYLDPVNNRPKGSESLSTFYYRVKKIFKEIITQYNNKNIIIVTHAGVIRAVITYVLQAELNNMYRINVMNAGITRIQHTGTHSILERHGFYFN